MTARCERESYLPGCWMSGNQLALCVGFDLDVFKENFICRPVAAIEGPGRPKCQWRWSERGRRSIYIETKTPTMQQERRRQGPPQLPARAGGEQDDERRGRRGGQ